MRLQQLGRAATIIACIADAASNCVATTTPATWPPSMSVR